MSSHQTHGDTKLLLIGIDEAGYGPVLGPLCHGYAAFRIPDSFGESGCDLWRALRPAVCRVNGSGIAIDDSKMIYSGSSGMAALERGVRSFMECANAIHPNAALSLNALIPKEDHDDLRRDFWFECNALTEKSAPVNCAKLRNVLANTGIDVLAFGARAQSVRMLNATLSSGVNKAEASWRTIARELKRLTSLGRSNESVFAAIDRQGGRKFYAPLLSETFESALVHVECETETESIYRFDLTDRFIRVGFYVEGDSKHFSIALTSMAAKLAREKYMLRFNVYFQKHQPGLKKTAGYYNDAQRFLNETAALRRRLNIDDESLIRAK